MIQKTVRSSIDWKIVFIMHMTMYIVGVIIGIFTGDGFFVSAGVGVLVMFFFFLCACFSILVDNNKVPMNIHKSDSKKL